MIETVKEKVELKKYSEFKDSGAVWLGKLPSHWDCIKMKYLYRDVSHKNRPKEELLSVTQDKGVVPRTWVENRMVMPSGNLESFKFIEEGDFAISLRSFQGGLEYCYHDGIISPAYTVLKSQKTLNSGYYKYLFKCKSFISELQTSVVGIRQGKNISFSELSYSLLPIPSPEEQTTIANYLDQKTEQIDQAIEIKRKQIELLKERRQILIHKAVTRGLNPDASLKPSGVDWIGDIPEHWSLTKLRQCLEPVSVKNKPGLQLLSITREEGLIIRDVDDLESNHNFIPDDLSGYKVIREGQFGMNKMKAWQGSYGVSKFDGLVSPAYYVFDLITDINPDFFHLAIRSSLYVSFFGAASDGVRIGQWDLNKSRMKEIPFIVPPENEQKRIIDYISNENEKTFEIITDLKNQIQKLGEYKTTLINSVVTGKIKVV